MATDSLVFSQGPLNPTAKALTSKGCSSSTVLIFNPQNTRKRGSVLQPLGGIAKLHIESGVDVRPLTCTVTVHFPIAERC